MGVPRLKEARTLTFKVSALPAETSKPAYRNRILSRLDAHDINLLQPHLKPVELRLRQRLEVANRPVETMYFIEDGLVSVVASARPGGKQAEVGLIGFEGMTGQAIVTGAGQSPNDAVMQSDGRGHCIDARIFQEILARSSTLTRRCVLYGFVFHIQAAQTVLANAGASAEQRLSRWLLMAQDRLSSDELRLTHETLSTMLGIRRPGVTIALQRLEKLELVSTARGSLLVQDRAGLVKLADGFYGVPEAEYERLVG